MNANDVSYRPDLDYLVAWGLVEKYRKWGRTYYRVTPKGREVLEAKS